MSPELAAAITAACDHLDALVPAFERLEEAAFLDGISDGDLLFVSAISSSLTLLSTATSMLRGCVVDAQRDGAPAHTDDTTGGG